MTKEQTNKELTAAERAEEIRVLRNGRKAMNGSTSRFPQLPVRPGFHTRWVNDEKGKVEQRIKDGWSFRERSGFTDDKVDLAKNPRKRIQVRVGSKEDLSDLFAYAMDLPLEIYNEDRKEKLKPVDRKEQFIKSGKIEAAGGLDYKVEADIKTNQSNFQPD